MQYLSNVTFKACYLSDTAVTLLLSQSKNRLWFFVFSSRNKKEKTTAQDVVGFVNLKCILIHPEAEHIHYPTFPHLPALLSKIHPP